MSESPWSVWLPFRGGAHAKSRLDLPSDQRQKLAREWLERALQACRQLPRVGEVLVLSTTEMEGMPHRVQRVAGLNPALEEARAALQPVRLLVLLPDLPCLQADDLEALLSACPIGGASLAPDRHGQGSNALALDGVPDFPFRFGLESCVAHTRAAASLGVDLRTVHVPGLARDVDTLDDLKQICAGVRCE